MTFPEFLYKTARENGGVTRFCKRVGIERESFYDYVSSKVLPTKKIVQRIIRVMGIDNIPDEVITDYHDRCEIMRLKNPHSKVSTTICWFCKNAVPDVNTGAGCSWSRYLIPVNGWEAVPCNLQTLRSFNVVKCPEFVSDVDAYDEETPENGTERGERLAKLEQKMIAEGVLKPRAECEKEFLEKENEHRRKAYEHYVNKRVEINRRRKEKRDRMKIEDPEKYNAIKEHQRIKAAERRHKLKEAMDG